KYHVAVGRLLKQTGALLRRSADHRSTDRQSPQAICEIHLTPKGRHPRQRLIGVRQRTLHIRHRAAELDLLVDAYLTARLCPGQKGPSSSQLVDWQSGSYVHRTRVARIDVVLDGISKYSKGNGRPPSIDPGEDLHSETEFLLQIRVADLERVCRQMWAF